MQGMAFCLALATSVALAPNRTSPAMQTELQAVHTTTQLSGCGLCLVLLPGMEGKAHV